MTSEWLEIRRGEAPLVVSIPHTGLDLRGVEPRLVSPWLARKDADWWIEQLYDFVVDLGATVIRTRVSRTVIDVNRDPSGASLYPGQATTGLCPTTSFDGEPLYLTGGEPTPQEIAERRSHYFEPYQAALGEAIGRLKRRHGVVLLYDCHSIRSIIPRLFDGELPAFNLGTNSGACADPALVAGVRDVLAASGENFVIDGRFKGGWITRHFGKPSEGVHALQMELACRAYIDEPLGPVDQTNWPVAYRADYAAKTRDVLKRILATALNWALAGASAR